MLACLVAYSFHTPFITVLMCEIHTIYHSLPAMEELGVSSVECVILSLVPEPRETESFLDELKPLWSALEELVEKGSVYTLGVSDLTKDQLEGFYDWAKVGREHFVID